MFIFSLSTTGSGRPPKVIVKLNDEEKCPNQKVYMPVNETHLDVMCDVDFLVDSVSLIGPISERICTIYLTSGMNLSKSVYGLLCVCLFGILCVCFF